MRLRLRSMILTPWISFLRTPLYQKKIETRTCLCSYKLQLTTNLRLTCAWLSFSCICVWRHPLFWTKLTSIFYSRGDSPIRNLAISVISRSAFSCDIGHRKWLARNRTGYNIRTRKTDLEQIRKSGYQTRSDLA